MSCSIGRTMLAAVAVLAGAVTGLVVRAEAAEIKASACLPWLLIRTYTAPFPWAPLPPCPPPACPPIGARRAQASSR